MTDAAFARPWTGAPKESWFHRNRRALAPWLFLAPGVLFFLFYVIFPIVQSFNISLYKWDGLGEARYIGLENYNKLFNDRAFETSLWNNLKWLVLYLLAVPAGLFIAIFLNQTVAGIRLYKSLFFFPFVISQVVVGLVFTWFYDPTFGLLNTILGWFGTGPLNVLGDPSLVTYGIIAAGLWPQTAYCMILYLTGLNAVDPEQVEAGRLDGARGWRMLWYVVLPPAPPRDLHRLRGDDHRSTAILRPHLDHDERRSVRIVAGAVVLHVREGALRVRLPHGVRGGHLGGAVPHHAGLHRLVPVVHAPGRTGRVERCFPPPSATLPSSGGSPTGCCCRFPSSCGCFPSSRSPPFRSSPPRTSRAGTTGACLPRSKRPPITAGCSSTATCPVTS